MGYVRVTFAEKPARTILDALHAAEFHWGNGSWAGKGEALPQAVCDMIEAPARVEPTIEPANAEQQVMEIPGAREADAEAEATRQADQHELADRQPLEKPVRAFAVPEGPLFGLFQR